MEKLDQVDIVRVLLEVLLQEEVDGRLENEGIVDGNVTDSLLSKGMHTYTRVQKKQTEKKWITES